LKVEELGFDFSEHVQCLESNQHNSITACYQLLLGQSNKDKEGGQELEAEVLKNPSFVP